jgi:hypothetical protein
MGARVKRVLIVGRIDHRRTERHVEVTVHRGHGVVLKDATATDVGRPFDLNELRLTPVKDVS